MRRLLPILIAGTLLGALLPAAASADATVNVPPNNVIFDPAGVTIAKGQSVNWNFSTANLDHNILFFAKDASFPTTNPGPSGAAFTFTVGGATSFQKTFNEAGLFRYLCTLHFASMRGTVTVTEPTPPPPPPPPGAKPLPPEPIAVASDRAAPFTAEIFTLTGSEANAKQLTTSGGEELDPAWSYDATHRQIAWSKLLGPDAHILVADADGANQVDLTPGAASFNIEPSWSPDSSKIAFSSTRTGNGDIYVMDFDGGNVRRLTSDAAFDRHPTWSPDGRRIAFASNRTGVSRVWIMDVDPDGTGEGTNPRQMTTEFPLPQSEPEWSPIDDRIVYTQLRGSGDPDPDPTVFDLTTGEVLAFMTGSLDDDEAPTWGPDGKNIIWSRFDGDTRDLYINSSGGGEAAPITTLTDALSYHMPAWQPAPKPAKPRPVPPPPPPPPPPADGSGGTGGTAGTGATGGTTAPPPADPGTAIRPSAFLALDVPHRTKVDAFRKLGLPVEARCTNLVKGTVRLTVSRKVARSLGLKGTKLASAAATCGADKRAAVLLKPGKTVKRALATTRARAAVRRARGLKATLTVFFEGGDSTLTDKLAITLAR